jgi:hypothetical protein
MTLGYVQNRTSRHRERSMFYNCMTIIKRGYAKPSGNSRRSARSSTIFDITRAFCSVAQPPSCDLHRQQADTPRNLTSVIQKSETESAKAQAAASFVNLSSGAVERKDGF